MSFSQTLSAVKMIYHLSFPLALLLTVAGFATCSRWHCTSLFALPLTLDLHALAKHNRIEHDASLVHEDTLPGSQYAPTAVSQRLLGLLLQQASSKNGLSLEDFATARIERERATGGPLDGLHEQIGQGEAALTWARFADEGTGRVTTETLRQWMGEERLPDHWLESGNQATLTLLEARRIAQRVGVEMNRVTNQTENASYA